MARITIFSKQSVHAASLARFLAAARRDVSVRDRADVLRFEPLEDRRMLATFTVTNLNDATVTGPGSAPGTLRQAIYDANISSDADIIDFAPGLSGDLRLSIADDSAIGLSALLVTSPITIQGNAAGITIKRDITAPEMRFFRVALGGDLTLDSINLTGGITRGTNGASGQNGGSAFAGAIYNQGNLQIIASTLYNNTAIGGNAGAGGNSGAGQGGAVFNDGGNVPFAIQRYRAIPFQMASAPLSLAASAAEFTRKNGLLTIDNSTITNGSAASGRELYIIGIGAGQTATAQIHSSIIAQSDVTPHAYDFNATDDLGGQVIVTGSNNLIRSQNLFQSITVSSDDPLLGAVSQQWRTNSHSRAAGRQSRDRPRLKSAEPRQRSTRRHVCTSCRRHDRHRRIRTANRRHARICQAITTATKPSMPPTTSFGEKPRAPTCPSIPEPTAMAAARSTMPTTTCGAATSEHHRRPQRRRCSTTNLLSPHEAPAATCIASETTQL